MHIGTGGAAVQILDAATGTYRDSVLGDLWTMMRVVDELPNIHYGLRPLVARDIEDPLELDLNTAFAVTAATAKPTARIFFEVRSSILRVTDSDTATMKLMLAMGMTMLASPNSIARIRK